MGWLGNILGNQTFQGLIGAGAGYYLQQADIDRLKDMRSESTAAFGQLQDQARASGTFTPYTITGTQGQASTALNPNGSFGGLNVGLDPNIASQVGGVRDQYYNSIRNFSPVGQMSPLYGQQQIASGLRQGMLGQDIISQLGIGTGRSEQDIYRMLEAMQSPDRERERLALRDELAGQGRLGVSTNMYGGTPEELARAKAVEEARSSNAFRAFQLAGEEQGRLANQRLQSFQLGEQALGRMDQSLLQSFGLGTDSYRAANDLTRILGELQLGQLQAGSDVFKNSYLPEQMLLQQLGAGTDIADLTSRNRIYGEQLAQTAGTNAMEQMFNIEGMLANARFNQNNQLLSLLLGAMSQGEEKDGRLSNSGLLGQAFDWLSNKL